MSSDNIIYMQDIRAMPWAEAELVARGYSLMTWEAMPDGMIKLMGVKVNAE